MSENEYLLPLTESEREDLIFAALNEVADFNEINGGGLLAESYQRLADKLRALEPVGTTEDGA